MLRDDNYNLFSENMEPGTFMIDVDDYFLLEDLILWLHGIYECMVNTHRL